MRGPPARGGSAFCEVLDEDQQLVDSFAIVRQRKNNIFSRHIIHMRSDIEGLAPQRFTAVGNFHIGTEYAAGCCHMLDFAERRPGPVLREVVDDIGADEAEPEIPWIS